MAIGQIRRIHRKTHGKTTRQRCMRGKFGVGVRNHEILRDELRNSVGINSGRGGITDSGMLFIFYQAVFVFLPTLNVNEFFTAYFFGSSRA